MRKLLIAGLLALLLVTLMPTAAQTNFTDEELALIEELTKAQEAVSQLSSLRSLTTQVIEQEIFFMGQTITQTITQDIDSVGLVEDGEVVAFSGVVFQTLESDMGLGGTSRMEVIYVDETFYVRVSESTGLLAGAFPVGWVNLTENPASFPGMENLDLTAFVNIDAPITADNVLTIEAVDVPEDIPDAVRAIAVTVDTLVLIQTGQFDAFAESFGAMGMNVDTEALLEALFDGAEFALVIYLNDIGLMIQSDSVLVMSADIGPFIGMGTFLIDQTIYSTTINTDFNIDVEITAPID